MEMLLTYNGIFYDNECRVFDVLTSDVDIRIKIIELYNLIFCAHSTPKFVLADRSTPPDVVKTLGLSGMVELYNALVYRVSVDPVKLTSLTWLNVRNAADRESGTITPKDIKKMYEYHQRKMRYYEIISYLDELLAGYTVTDEDIPYIMNLDMDNADKLRFIVIGHFYERQSNGLNAEIEVSKVEELQERLAKRIGDYASGGNSNLYVLKGYLMALDVVVQHIINNKGKE